MNNQEILNSLNEKIKAAEEALLYLNQTKAGLERVIANSKKSPVEEAYKDWYGGYPSDGIAIDNSWDAFQAGYNAAYKEPEDTVWKSVALRFGEKLSDIGPCGYYEFSPDEWFEWVVNTYEKLADDWLILLKKEKLKKEKEWTYKVTDEKGETNPYKQYMNSVKNLEENNWYVDAKSLVNPPTLWERFYAAKWSDSACDEFCEIVEQWLPKEQSANSQNTYVELTVEGFNDCLNQIKSKLR